MLGQDEIWRILSLAQEACHADANQVSLIAEDSGLTRFANGGIHQNVAERNAVLQVKAILGKRTGYVETNALDEESVRTAAQTAVEFARLAVENPNYVDLPGPNAQTQGGAQWDEATAACSPEARADLVGQVLAEAEPQAVVASGSLSTAGIERAVMNSRGLRAYYRNTETHLVVACTKATGNGWAERHSPWLHDISAASAAKEAVQGCLSAQEPQAIEPGDYPVVLMPYAVEDMLQTLGWMGMGALAVQEQRSWMAGRIGEQLAGANVSVWDDGLDPRGFVRPFDPEGVARRRVDILKDGVALGPVYDSLTAHKEGRQSTGHATSALGNWGPSPANLVMPGADDALEDLLRRMGRGLLVTRFHYTNVIHPIETTFTGMTRDGTFLVEGGQIVRPVKNLRFTQSILGALNAVEAAGRDVRLFQHTLCPPLLIHSFHFTGGTDF
ncbi:MAG TPA: TldD/PmbA family protein [Armatimonadota bacterium]|jgi:predicted Zn-dependent protease